MIFFYNVYYMSGKKEFKKLINYMNEIKFWIPDYVKFNLNELINKWNKKNKNIDDYFEMKKNLTELNGFFNLGNESKKKEDELWREYKNKTLEYRVKNMHKSDNLLFMNFN